MAIPKKWLCAENSSLPADYWQIVRCVLMAMGYEEPTYCDFRLWDDLIDWRATAKLLDQPPVNTALCHIIDKRGDIVISEGEPVVVARDVVADTEAEVAEILAKESLNFIRWWPSDSRSVADENQNEACKNIQNEQGTSKDHHCRTFAATRDFFAGRKCVKRASKEKLLF